MPKIKRKRNQTKGRCFRVLMSFEWNRKRLPKSKAGILVRGERVTIQDGEWFTENELERLIQKGYLKELKPKGKKKEKAKAAH